MARIPEGMVERLGEVFRRTGSRLEPDTRAQFAALLQPDSLKMVAASVVAWVVSHFFGIGELFDLIMTVVGIATIGVAVFDGIDELKDFAIDTHDARTEADLDRAADHLAEAVVVLGIQAVLTVLFHGRAKTYKGEPVPMNPEPPRNSWMRYQPQTKGTLSKGAGGGWTTEWGDIFYSLHGSDSDRALVLLHERVHQILTPRLYPLRAVRVRNRLTSYVRSSLRRYLEEALAEAVSRIGVEGLRRGIIGMKFPVNEGYVYLRFGGGSANEIYAGKGVLPELGGLLGSGNMLGLSYQIWLKHDPGSRSVVLYRQ